MNFSGEAIEMTEEIGLEAEFSLTEPCLSYHRLENDFKSVYSTTEISAVAAHLKFIVLGCKNGSVNIFDHLGNLIQNGSYKNHFSAVNSLSITDNGDFVASCASDGFVLIYDLMEPKNKQCINLHRPVKSVALAPNYHLSKKLVTADRKVVLWSKGTFKKHNMDEIYAPTSTVTNIKWRKDLLIWSDDEAVRVYDIRRRTVINYIPKNEDTSELLTGKFTCHLTWHSDNCFLIGWGKTAQICQIVNLSQNIIEPRWSSKISADRESVNSFATSNVSSLQIPSSALRCVQIATQIDLPDSIICGIATHLNYIMLLLSPIDKISITSDSQVRKKLQIFIADVGDNLNSGSIFRLIDADQASFLVYSYEEVNREEILLNVPQQANFQDIGLSSILTEDVHLIFAPNDVIYAQAPSADFRIKWFLEQNLPQRALEVAKHNSSDLVNFSPKTLGMNYMEDLLKNENYLAAAALCSDILTGTQAWEDIVYRFYNLDKLHVLTPYLNLCCCPLSASVYELVLIDMMSKSPKQFFAKLKEWPPNSGNYSAQRITNALEDRTSTCTIETEIEIVAKQNPDMLMLWRSLIILYEQTGYPDKGLELSIKLRDPHVFDFLRRQLPDEYGGRFGTVFKKHIFSLFTIDVSKTIDLLIDNMQELPVDFVVQELSESPQLLYQYLECLYTRNPRSAQPHIPLMLNLYAKYARDKLLKLLQSTNHYSLNEALQLCQNLNYVPETVYLLTRVGRRREALRLLMETGEEEAMKFIDKPIIAEQKRAEVAAQAIAYCQEEDRSHCFGFESSTVLPMIDEFCPRKIASSMSSEEITPAGSDREDEIGLAEPNSAFGEAGELWKQVVLFAVDKPTFICALLKHVSTESIDPRILLRKIAPNTKIPKLKDSLVTLLHNTQMQVELRKTSQQILLTDSNNLFTEFISTQGRGIHVNILEPVNQSVCKKCRQPLIKNDITESRESLEIGIRKNQPSLIVFRCSHCYHAQCLLRIGRSTVYCPVCAHERLFP